MSTLAKSLQKYYTRKGNRIIFSNGMTLNQLAMEMWERLDYTQIDSSVLSRVVKGERLFTISQLLIFAKVLKISKSETSLLKEMLAKELLSKFGFSGDLFFHKNQDYIDFLKDAVQKIELMRANDFPIFALEWIDNIEERIKNSLKNDSNTSSRKDLLALLSTLLIERKRALFAVCGYNNIPRLLLILPNELEKIGKELKDSNLEGLAYSVRSSLLYYQKKYDEALNWNIKALPLIKMNLERAVTLGRLAILYGKQGKEIEVSNIKNILLKKFDGLSIDLRCYIWQSIVQAETQARLFYDARKSLEKAWSLYDIQLKETPNYKVIRKIQLIRTELELASAMKPKKSLSHFEEISRESLDLVKKHGYTTFTYDINRYSKELLSN